jgi:hypothetical protein
VLFLGEDVACFVLLRELVLEEGFLEPGPSLDLAQARSLTQAQPEFAEKTPLWDFFFPF